VFATPAFQVFLEQRDGPFDGLIAEVLWSPLQTGTQGRQDFVGPNGGSIPTALVCQAVRIIRRAVACDPVMNARPAGPEKLCNIDDGSAGSRFQDGQGTPEDASIVCGPQLLFESSPLYDRQL
jgi:hypothetical protein